MGSMCHANATGHTRWRRSRVVRYARVPVLRDGQAECTYSIFVTFASRTCAQERVAQYVHCIERYHLNGQFQFADAIHVLCHHDRHLLTDTPSSWNRLTTNRRRFTALQRFPALPESDQSVRHAVPNDAGLSR